jgi:hypothetical protein
MWHGWLACLKITWIIDKKVASLKTISHTHTHIYIYITWITDKNVASHTHIYIYI